MVIKMKSAVERLTAAQPATELVVLKNLKERWVYESRECRMSEDGRRIRSQSTLQAEKVQSSEGNPFRTLEGLSQHLRHLAAGISPKGGRCHLEPLSPPASQPFGEELHYGQHLLSVRGHAAVCLLPLDLSYIRKFLLQDVDGVLVNSFAASAMADQDGGL